MNLAAAAKIPFPTRSRMKGRKVGRASESREDDIEGNDLATMTFAIDSVRGKEGRELGDWLPTVININEQNPIGHTDKHKIREL